jgi:hypothetical protein
MITPTEYTKLKVDLCDYIAPGTRYKPLPYVYHEAYSGSLNTYYKCNTCPANLCNTCFDKYEAIQERIYNEELQERLQQEIRDNASDSNNSPKKANLLVLAFSDSLRKFKDKCTSVLV